MRTKNAGIGLFVVLAVLALSWATMEGRPGRGQDKGRTPEIARGVFVDHGYHSPPWYPPEEETDSYRWGPPLRWADTDLPVNCTVYTSGAPANAFTAVQPAFTEWDENTSADLYGTVAEDNTNPPPGVVYDEQNTMSWGTIDGPGGIVAVCSYWYYVGTKRLVEFDIVFDAAEAWSTNGAPGTFDIRNIATHELGHTLVLQDLRSPKDGALTMHAYTWLGDTGKRSLGSGDIRGVQAIYDD